MTDFSKPQRMSLQAFFVYFFKYFKLSFDVAVIFLLFNIFTSEAEISEKLLMGAKWIGGISILSLILAAVSYFQIRFHIEDGKLIYRHNLISRAITTIPINKIHSLRTRQGIVYRILGLRGILFDTLASKGEEIELILSESDWQSLLRLIESQEKSQATSPDVPPAFDPSHVKKFSNYDLLRDALCQNHLKGMVILGGFAVAAFGQLSDLSSNSAEMMTDWVEAHFYHFSISIAAITIIMVSMYLASLAVWLGKVMLRYYDLTLTYDSKTLSFSHGLLSRMTTRFAHNKICTIRIKRNIIEKKLGLCSLSLRQALNSTAQKEEDNLQIHGRDCSGFFLRWWLGDDFESETDITTAKSGKGLVFHSLLPDVLLSCILVVVLCHFELYGWLILPAIYLMTAVPKAIMAMRHSLISLRDSYIIVGNGRFAEIKNYLKYANVEVVKVTRTPLTRLTGRVTLTLSTSGTTFSIRSLPLPKALHLYELILAKSLTGRCN